MPQIKTFVRYHAETGRIAWMVLASNNLSEGAWGVLEADEFQLLIKSFEIGVLLLPSLELEYLRQPKFFDAPSGNWNENEEANRNPPWTAVEFRHLVTASGTETSDVSPSATTKVVYLPLPYDLPAPATKYMEGVDMPWYT